VTKIRRIIEREPSRGRKVVRAIGIVFLVLGIVLALAGIGGISGAVFILGIVLVIIGLIMMRAGRKKREVISEEGVADDDKEEKEKEKQKQKGEQESKDALANRADLLKSQSSKQKEEELAVLMFSEVEDPSGLVRLTKAAKKGQA
jgi:predicted tellurium resistance membrane protein TerC